MRIVDTSAWAWGDLQPHWPAIVHALKRRAERFPNDESLEMRVRHIIGGVDRLWLIFDEEVPIMALLVSIVTCEASGHRRLVIDGVGATPGADGVGFKRKIDECMPLVAEVEAWGAEQGITEVEIRGRRGWKRLFEPYGYGEAAVVLRKKIGGSP